MIFDPSRAFLILSPPRSGSTLLHLFLDHTGVIRCHGELLGRELRGFESRGLPGVAGRPKSDVEAELSELRQSDPIRLMKEYALACDNVEAVGFKIHYYTVVSPEFA